jgi:hypothetical protein
MSVWMVEEILKSVVEESTLESIITKYLSIYTGIESCVPHPLSRL